MSTETETAQYDALAMLRKPFPAESIAKLPKVNCRNCSQGNGSCKEHPNKRSCKECGNWITPGHIHLNYVGHAETTDRLLDADPTWTWEPLATTPQGLPQLDEFGGMWIRLTVAGVTRIGYGAAGPNKRGPDAIKEIIGDALRNAGMRFGVALDLWAKTDLHADEREEEPAAEPERPAQRERARAEDEWSAAGPALATAQQLSLLAGGLSVVRGAGTPEARRTAISQILGRPFVEGEQMTLADAERVRLALEKEKRQSAVLRRQEAAQAERAAGPTPNDPVAANGAQRMMHALFREKGIGDGDKHAFITRVLGGDIETMARITRSQCDAVILALTTGEVPAAPAVPDRIAPSDEGFDEFAALTQMIHDVHDEQSRVEAQKAIDTERAAGSIDDDDVRLLRERLAEQAKAIPAGVAA